MLDMEREMVMRRMTPWQKAITKALIGTGFEPHESEDKLFWWHREWNLWLSSGGAGKWRIVRDDDWDAEHGWLRRQIGMRTRLRRHDKEAAAVAEWVKAFLATNWIDRSDFQPEWDE